MVAIFQRDAGRFANLEESRSRASKRQTLRGAICFADGKQAGLERERAIQSAHPAEYLCAEGLVREESVPRDKI